MIERKILIALITQTEFMRQIHTMWKSEYMESSAARMMAEWCWEYYKKYKKAPLHDIENIYIKKLKRTKIDKDLAEEIEHEILPSLSEEYEKENVNNLYLIEETKAYFVERQLTIFQQTLETLLDKGKFEEANALATNFRVNTFAETEGLDLSHPALLDVIDRAFDTTFQNVVKFPGALGDFWNDQLVRGSLIGILASEKKGKSFLLLEFMMRAYHQKKKIVFFQAGDMTENQQIMRICTYLAKKSNKEKYCGIQYIPVQDCVKNQLDTCDKKIRECDFGVFHKDSEKDLREELDMDELKEAYHENPKYKACFNCVEWTKNRWGSPWLQQVEIKTPLTATLAKKLAKKFFIDTNRSVKLYTYANGTLTLSMINQKLDELKEEGFEPELILIDYGDLIEPEVKMEFRHQENAKWKGMRKISQERDALVIVPTQADANSYSLDRLTMKNFNEDKRKFAHVTAMYGLNQDTEGREKKMGILRINKIVVREEEFHVSDEVYVLQNLSIGRPFLGSYY
jgi:hypothetical protein